MRRGGSMRIPQTFPIACLVIAGTMLGGCTTDQPAPLATPPAESWTSADGGCSGATSDDQPDAGKPDARRTDSAAERPYPDTMPAPDAFFGESRCPAGARFCENFESGALDPAKWRPTKLNGATATFDSTRAAR